MSLSKFLRSRTFFGHLMLAILLVLALLIGTMQVLKIYTRQGDTFPVPDFSGLTVNEAMKAARQYDLEIAIMDSLFMENAPPGVIVDQVPNAEHHVKKGRTIFLTINSTQPEQVTLPQLTDISFRQAQALIENSGLQIGNIAYRPSEYSDLVLEVQKDSRELVPGQKLPKGTPIDLVVGREQGNQVTDLPDLTGLRIPNARETLTDAMLNMGVVIYDESVLSAEDSTNARVWKQSPNPKVTATANLGSSVDLWVTVDHLKIEDAMELDF